MFSNLPRQLRFDQERLHFTSGAVNNRAFIAGPFTPLPLFTKAAAAIES